LPLKKQFPEFAIYQQQDNCTNKLFYPIYTQLLFVFQLVAQNNVGIGIGGIMQDSAIVATGFKYRHKKAPHFCEASDYPLSPRLLRIK
jgi:hypothetical protein